jgi:hypothetical protein
MPIFPADQARARAISESQKRARAQALAEAREQQRQAEEREMAAIRELANEMRARDGLPPLAPDEPVNAIICRRGRR